MATITNRNISRKSADWAADVISGGQFTHRVSITMRDGKQQIRLRPSDKTKSATTITVEQPMSIEQVVAWVNAQISK